MSRNLFNISEEYLRIIDMIEELEGEVTPELEEMLHINRNEYEAKMKAYHYVIKQADGDIQLLKDEQANLGRRVKSKENMIERLKATMLAALELYGNDGKSGNKTSKFDTVTIYNVYHKPLIIDEEMFNNEDYIKYGLNDKLTKQEAETIASLLLTMRHAGKASSKEDIDDFISKLMNKSITRDKLKEDLKLGTKVEYATLDEKASYISRR